MPALTFHQNPIRFEEQVTLVVHQGTAVITDESGTYSVEEGDQHSTPSAGGCTVAAANIDGCNVYVLNEPTDTVDRGENKAAKQPREKFTDDPPKKEIAKEAKALDVKGRSKKKKAALKKAVAKAEKKADHAPEKHPEPKATKRRPKPAAEKRADAKRKARK